MGGVEYYRCKLSHDCKRAHIYNQVVVAETRPALGDEYAVISSGVTLFNPMPHVPRGDELALFDVHCALAHGGSNDQICLPAEEGGNLKHVGNFGDFGDIRGFMHISEDWDV